MNLYKTHKSERKTYSYVFYDEAGNKTVSVIRPGKDGVTEVDIKHLHYADDYQVQLNNEYLKVKPTKSEKSECEAWCKRYIDYFKAQYGYIPNSDDVKYQMGIHFGSKTLISIDRLEDELDNETLYLSVNDKHMFEDELTTYILSLLQNTSDPYKFEYVYKYFLLAGRKHIEIIAKDLGVSVGRISQIANKITEILKNDKKIQEFYAKAKKISENDCLEIQEGTK